MYKTYIIIMIKIVDDNKFQLKKLTECKHFSQFIISYQPHSQENPKNYRLN